MNTNEPEPQPSTPRSQPETPPPVGPVAPPIPGPTPTTVVPPTSAPAPPPSSGTIHSNETDPPKEGGEDWWKRLLVVAGFTFVNGFVALRAFTTCLGLTPQDFVFGDYDYFIQGLLYLLGDYQVFTVWSADDLPYGLILLATWVLLWLTLQFSFVWRFRRPMVLPLALALLAVIVTIVGTHHGRLRAKNFKRLSQFLPPVIVRYHPLGDETATAIAAGRLVARNDKVVCLTRIHGWKVGPEDWVDPGDLDVRFVILPMERVESLSVNVD
ncbi:MAG: hypothetical protein JNK85_21120 [Verrucomicrobiales bacterium]|nr:hypothetical protein [Verrucomicrobiales bacterium]